MELKRIFLVVATATALSACAIARDDYSAADYVSDAQITASLKAKYAGEADVPATQVKIDTMNGIVQLSGFVPNPAAKERAGEIARSTKGVKSVRNDIIVR